MDFDEAFEYLVTGGMSVLIVALVAFVIWGIFFSSNEIIQAVTTVIGVAIGVVFGLIVVGFLVKEYLL